MGDKGKLNDARDISERDPMWLKGKGDDFYRSRDFQSAANAYSAAIAVDPEDPMVPALSNRAACYLRMGKYKLCRVDCSRVIECLPPVPNAAASGKLNPRELRKAQLGTRSRILVRRGAASCELGEYQLAVVDYKEAGDVALRRKDTEQAVESYSKAIELDASFVSALSNRSAAYLVLGKWQLAVDDCTAALLFLQGNVSENGPPGAVPRGGSARHASFTAKTLARRATALCKTKEYATALEDLQAALVLDPSNAKLVADLERVGNLLKTTTEKTEEEVE